MSGTPKGQQITLAFNYIAQVFKECQRLIFKVDNHMAPEWKYLYGNRITKGVSANLQEPEDWLVRGIFRYYERAEDQFINKGITIAFWDDDINEPIITAGKIAYNDPGRKDHWDLWCIWHEWAWLNENNKPNPDGSKHHFQPPEGSEYIKEAQAFSWPLVDISDDEKLMEKIILPLDEL
ncbi:hypothetical protein [Dethiobacter alkaliphilus]|uniref:hypothetical protein n=1 Tax=Dethiobacter alkaliphilus TaxID=427926 RepID=UPI0022265CCB|nr:hypothetical protein [Dethiobacter alkaliphilus]MCW3490218.1 hypothetical protein [Dethiobacter alkaliphilus]